MNVDPRLIAVGAVALIVILWAIATLLHRVDWRVTARGVRNGSIVAAILFVITTFVVTIYLNGRVDRLERPISRTRWRLVFSRGC